MVLKSQAGWNPKSPSVRGVTVVRVTIWLLRVSRLLNTSLIQTTPRPGLLTIQDVQAPSLPEQFVRHAASQRLSPSHNRCRLSVTAPVPLSRSPFLARSVHFVVCPHGDKKDCLAAFVFDEFEQNSQIVPHTARPDAFQVAGQLVRLQPRIKGVVRQHLQGCLHFSRERRPPLQKSPKSTNERRRSEQFTIHGGLHP
jgi:hypothetical protein